MNRLEIESLDKSYTLHLRGGQRLPVLHEMSLQVAEGECVALTGASGSGKSTLLRLIYGNCRAQTGIIRLRHAGQWVDIARADARQLLRIRQETLGYASQFLRVIPRISARNVVAEAMLRRGIGREEAGQRAGELLEAFNLPCHLHALPPATFSGGEQQRVNLARAFAGDYPLLLLDEPTASLDAVNAQVVCDFIAQARQAGRSLLCVFHDSVMTHRVADRIISLTPPEETLHAARIQ